VDLVVSNEAGELFFFENAGTKTIQVWTERRLSENPLYDVRKVMFPRFYDVSGDGVLDIVSMAPLSAANEFTGLFVVKCTAQGMNDWTEKVLDANPVSSLNSRVECTGNCTASSYYRYPTLVDVNNDGRLDLVVAVTKVNTADGAIGETKVFQHARGDCHSWSAIVPSPLLSTIPAHSGGAAYVDRTGDGEIDVIVRHGGIDSVHYWASSFLQMARRDVESAPGVWTECNADESGEYIIQLSGTCEMPITDRTECAGGSKSWNLLCE